MLTAIKLENSPQSDSLDQGVVLLTQEEEIFLLPFSEEEKSLLKRNLYGKKKDSFLYTTKSSQTLFVTVKPHKAQEYALEFARNAGATAWDSARDWEVPRAFFFGGEEKLFLAFIEGMMLSSYRFDKYLSEKKTYPTLLEVVHPDLHSAAIKEIEITVKATFSARDLVNEPVSYLDTHQLGEEIERLGKQYGFETELFDQAEITSLKMAGLLAVNAGSKNPPLFALLKHSPKSKSKAAPVILVGKGIVYDTGGLSLKPTANSMDFMKSDMAGAAAVIGVFCMLGQLDLPFEVIGLIPITDNRPGYNAMAPGDVVTYSNGKTVEILNTDAEGRLVLAEALIYAQRYRPQLVIDLATLTGSAVAAVGKEAAVVMGTAAKERIEVLKQSGRDVFERLVEFPLWEEYGEQIRSEIADISNLGGPTAGAITAGKFLEHFIAYDWIHIDIAGPSFNKKGERYLSAGGTGFGVRLLYRFLKNFQPEKI